MEIMTIENVRGYIDATNTVWLNVEDVARGLGFTEIAASGNITIRWRTVRAYLADFGFIPTSGDGVKAGDYIPENIFYRLAMKAKNAVAEKFQAIVADEILPSIRRTGTYSVKAPTPVADMVNDVGAVAEKIQTLFGGVKRGIALSQAIDLVSEHNSFDMTRLKQLLPPAEHETGYLNATQIGERLNLGRGNKAAQRANELLKNAAFQCKDGRDWRLTDEGSVYGKEMPYTRNGHSGYQIRWSENVIQALLKRVPNSGVYSRHKIPKELDINKLKTFNVYAGEVGSEKFLLFRSEELGELLGTSYLGGTGATNTFTKALNAKADPFAEKDYAGYYFQFCRLTRLEAVVQKYLEQLKPSTQREHGERVLQWIREKVLPRYSNGKQS